MPSSLYDYFSSQAQPREVEEQPGVQYEDAPHTFISPYTNKEVTITRRQPVAPKPPTETDDLTDSVSLFDYGKQIMAGGASLVGGVGWLLKGLGDDQWGEKGDYTSRFGKAIETVGNDAVDYWNDSMSEAAKRELAKEFIQKDENGEWRWGDASAATVGLFGAQSLYGTAAGMGLGAGATKVLQVFGNPVARGALMDTVTAAGTRLGVGGGTAEKLGAVAMLAAKQPDALKKAELAAFKKLKFVDTVLGAAGFGLGEGAISGVFTGMNVEESVRRLGADSPEKMFDNPRFMSAYDSQEGLMDDDKRFAYALDTVAKQAATVAGFQSGLTTALLGAPMGAFFGPLFGKVGVRSINRTAATAIGAGGEAAQEFAQSATEALWTNKTLISLGDERDLFDDVWNQAVGGALAGGLMGGGFGFASGANPQDVAARNEKKGVVEAVDSEGKKVNVGPLKAMVAKAEAAGVPTEELVPIVEAGAQPGGMVPAIKAIRDLIEAKEATPDLETAQADVEAKRPKRPKRKGKKGKKPKAEPLSEDTVTRLDESRAAAKAEEALPPIAPTTEFDKAPEPTPDVDLNADLEARGEPIKSRVDAERRWSDGDDIYAFHEQDEGQPTKVTSMEMLSAYPPDSLMALPTESPATAPEVTSEQRRWRWRKGSEQEPGGPQKQYYDIGDSVDWSDLQEGDQVIDDKGAYHRVDKVQDEGYKTTQLTVSSGNEAKGGTAEDRAFLGSIGSKRDSVEYFAESYGPIRRLVPEAPQGVAESAGIDQAPEVTDEKFNDPAEIWKGELTQSGREDLLRHAGLAPEKATSKNIDNAKIDWKYLPKAHQKKIADALPTFAVGGVTLYAPEPKVVGGGGTVEANIQNVPRSDKLPKGAIGRNPKGFPVYEDERGVRSYVESGIRISETVALQPGAEGMGVSVDKEGRSKDYLTTDEIAQQEAPEPEVVSGGGAPQAGPKVIINEIDMAAEAAKYAAEDAAKAAPEPTTFREANRNVKALIDAGASAKDVDSEVESIVKVPTQGGGWLSDNEADHKQAIKQFLGDAKEAGWRRVGRSRNSNNHAFEVDGKNVEVYKSGKGMGWNIHIDPPAKDWKRATQVVLDADPQAFMPKREAPEVSADVTPLDPALTAVEKADAMLAMGREVLPDVERALKRLDSELGYRSYPNFKELDKIVSKPQRPAFRAKYPNAGVEHVHDAFRFKSVVPASNVAGITKAIDIVVEETGATVLKFDGAKMDGDNPWGWRVLPVDLRMPNGLIVEYYFVLNEMNEAQDTRGHKLFEDWRDVDSEKLTDEQRPKYNRDSAESKKLYDAAFSAAAESAGLTNDALMASFSKLETSAVSLTRSQVISSPSVQSTLETSSQASPLRSSEGPSGTRTSTRSGRENLNTLASTEGSVPQTGPMEAIGAVFEGSDIAREQDFGDLEVTYEAEAEETGEVFSVTEDANVLFKQAVKRSDNLQKLRECVSG